MNNGARKTYNVSPNNPTVGISGILLIEERDFNPTSYSKFWGNSQYEDFSIGPLFVSQQEYKFTTDWWVKLDKSNSTLFSEKINRSLELNNKYVKDLLRYNWGDVQSISMDFDEVGLPALTFERSGLCNVRRLIDGVLFKTMWSGTSPRIFSNNTIQPNTAARDLACFYLNQSGALRYRIQRDAFAVEYSPYSGDALLFSEIYKITTDQANFKYRVFTKGRDGRDYMLSSQNYPNYPQYAYDSFSGNYFGFYTGVLFNVVNDIGVFTEPHSYIGLNNGVSSVTGGYRLVLNNIGTFREPHSYIGLNNGVSSVTGGYRLILNNIGTFTEPHSYIGLNNGVSDATGAYRQIAYAFTMQDSGIVNFFLASGKIV